MQRLFCAILGLAISLPNVAQAQQPAHQSGSSHGRLSQQSGGQHQSPPAGGQHQNRPSQGGQNGNHPSGQRHSQSQPTNNALRHQPNRRVAQFRFRRGAPTIFDEIQPPGGGGDPIVSPPVVTSTPIVPEVSITSAVPEPTTWAMMLLGFLLMGRVLRRGRPTASSASAIRGRLS
jgi:hypothetical protein